MIGIVVAVYSVYPQKLFASVVDSSRKVSWYIFFHGDDETLKEQLRHFAAENSNVTLLLYGSNRGLARSWNDGIRFSLQMGDYRTLIVNDDLYFRPGGFDSFMSFVDEQPSNFGLATVMGLELEDSPNSGQSIPQDLACCVVGTEAIKRVGYFDQNYKPAYFEDIDYVRRLHLADLSIIVDERVLVEHDRSKTSRTNEHIRISLPQTFAKNQTYFEAKWGGVFGTERFVRPFDDGDQSIYIGYDDEPLSGRIYPKSPHRECVVTDDSESLDTVGLRTDTDKCSKHHDFLRFYEPFIRPSRHEMSAILEVGVSAGGSVRMWEQYLPNTKVVALDINPAAVRHASSRVKIEIVDQSDPKALVDVAVKHGPFDLIIDDGSHFWDHQILTMQCLMPFVKRGGLYIMEDIDTSYGSYIPLYNNGANVSAAEYLKRLLDRVIGDSALDAVFESDLFLKSYARLIDSMNFYRRTCVIKLK